MSKTLAWIVPVEGGHPDQGLPGTPGHPDNSLPGGPEVWPPITLPPLPPGVWPDPPLGVWPPTWPGLPAHPIVIYPPRPDNSLPGEPGHPDNSLPMPPATIWPPLPPGTGIAGKALLLIWVVGVGYRWLVVEGPEVWPPLAQPK